MNKTSALYTLNVQASSPDYIDICTFYHVMMFFYLFSFTYRMLCLERSNRFGVFTLFDFGWVNTIAMVMTEAILHMAYEPFVDLRVMKPINGINDKDFRPFIVVSNVVDLANLTSGRYHVDSFTVVFHITPVTDLHTITVNRQSFMILCVTDHQRNQLLRELILPIVVAASCYFHRHPIGVVKSFHEGISRGFTAAVRGVRIDQRGLREEAFCSQRTVDLIRAYLNVLLPSLPRFLSCIVPSFFCPL